MAGLRPELVGRYCVASTRRQGGQAASGAGSEWAKTPLSEAASQQRPWQKLFEGGAGAGGRIVQRLAALRAAHLRRRTMLGSRWKERMWGDATRQILGILCNGWLPLAPMSCSAVASSGRGEGGW